jgi:hypothetical protein
VTGPRTTTANVWSDVFIVPACFYCTIKVIQRQPKITITLGYHIKVPLAWWCYFVGLHAVDQAFLRSAIYPYFDIAFSVETTRYTFIAVQYNFIGWRYPPKCDGTPGRWIGIVNHVSHSAEHKLRMRQETCTHWPRAGTPSLHLLFV